MSVPGKHSPEGDPQGAADPAQRLAAAVPAGVLARVATLVGDGGRAWVVGGAVRDILGQFQPPPTDWDLATDLPPERVAALFPGASLRDAHLGVVVLPGEVEVTVSTLRIEGGYRDYRRPDHVEFVSEPEADARRRDFSVNALYWDPLAHRLLDPTGTGVADLGRGLLRMVGSPGSRLREDPLRMLRAVRFAARCGFDFDADLAEHLRLGAALAGLVAAERVFDELTLTFTGPGRGRGLRLLVDTGLAGVVLPEVPPMDGVEQPEEYHPEGDVLTHVCAVLDHVLPGDPVQAWAAVLHDVGKPATFERAADRIRFTGHDALSADMAEAVLRRFHATRELRETVVEICRDHIRMASLPLMRPSTRERWLRSPRFPAHLAFHRADCLGSHGKLGIWEQATRWLADLPEEAPPPLVRGRDLIGLGVAPGPRIGRLLQELQEFLDRREATTGPADRDREREVALAWLRRRLRDDSADS